MTLRRDAYAPLAIGFTAGCALMWWAHIIGVDWAAPFRLDAAKPEVSTERW